MTRILLIRHATTELQGKVLYGRMPGVRLGEIGYRQAARLAEGLNGRHRIQRILASPLERAQETARAIAESANLNIETDERLTELDHGEWVGKSFCELEKLEEWKIYNRARAIMSAPNGESTLAAQVRAWTLIEPLQNEPDGATIAIVSHGDVIRAVLLLLLGVSLDHIWRLEVAPASVSEVKLYKSGAIIENINRTFE